MTIKRKSETAGKLNKAQAETPKTRQRSKSLWNSVNWPNC